MYVKKSKNTQKTTKLINNYANIMYVCMYVCMFTFFCGGGGWVRGPFVNLRTSHGMGIDTQLKMLLINFYLKKNQP